MADVHAAVRAAPDPDVSNPGRYRGPRRSGVQYLRNGDALGHPPVPVAVHPGGHRRAPRGAAHHRRPDSMDAFLGIHRGGHRRRRRRPGRRRRHVDTCGRTRGTPHDLDGVRQGGSHERCGRHAHRIAGGLGAAATDPGPGFDRPRGTPAVERCQAAAETGRPRAVGRRYEAAEPVVRPSRGSRRQWGNGHGGAAHVGGVCENTGETAEVDEDGHDGARAAAPGATVEGGSRGLDPIWVSVAAPDGGRPQPQNIVLPAVPAGARAPVEIPRTTVEVETGRNFFSDRGER
mmetsp:Transcript_24423/g.48641  ORF Transcript_24423/g.48641 Transcript_24423/m.48641 type:complete len:289 (-) Transcript_24423:151-1017(-)